MKKVILFSVFILFGLGVLGYAVEWTDTIDNGYQDVPKDVYFDGNYVYAFGCFYNGGDYDAYIVKYDTTGNIIWIDTLDRGNYDMFNAGVVDDDGYVYAVGYIYNDAGDRDFLIAQYNSYGVNQWVRIIDNGENEGFNDVDVDSLGSIVAIGESESGGIYNIVIAKYDFLSNDVWSDTINSGNNDFGYGIALYDTFVYTSGGYNGYIAIGKFNANNGDLVWADTSLVGEGEGRSIVVDGNGSIYTSGWFYNVISNDYLIIKLDADGNIIWQDTAGGVNDDKSYSIDCDNNGNVFVFGTSDNDAYLIEYSQDGDSLWALRIDNGDIDNGYGISVDKNTNDIYLCYSSYIGTNSDWLVSKYDSGESFVEDNIKMGGIEIAGLSVDKVRIKTKLSGFCNIRIYGIDGRLIKRYSGYLEKDDVVSFDMDRGIYYVNVNTDNIQTHRKVCVVK